MCCLALSRLVEEATADPGAYAVLTAADGTPPLLARLALCLVQEWRLHGPLPPQGVLRTGSPVPPWSLAQDESIVSPGDVHCHADGRAAVTGPRSSYVTYFAM